MPKGVLFFCENIFIKTCLYIKFYTYICSMNYLPVSEYAKKHNITVQGVYKRIERGTVEFKKFGGTYLVKE